MIKWLKKFWHIPLLLIAGIVVGIAGLLMGRRPRIGDGLRREFKAIDASEKVKEKLLTESHESAVAELEEEHKETLAALDAKQAAKVEKLKKDPAAMARWLVRVGSS